MATSACNHEMAEIVDSSGGVKSGRFKEHYECPCGAEGWVEGDAGAPASEWTRYGEVFDNGDV